VHAAVIFPFPGWMKATPALKGTMTMTGPCAMKLTVTVTGSASRTLTVTSSVANDVDVGPSLNPS
jgi:hypothetical protein